MTKEWRSDQEIEDNSRFGLHARVNAINMKAMLELQVLWSDCSERGGGRLVNMNLFRGASRAIASSVVMLCGLLFPLTFAWSYDVIDVQHGGTIEGTISLDGAVPEPKGFNLITFPDPAYCGRISNGRGWRLLHDFVVSPQGGLQDAIVLLEGVEAGKPFEMSVPLIEARDCIFQPFMTVVRNGHAVEVVNMDPVMHDIQGYETSLEAGARVLFNTPLVMNFQHRRGDIHAIHDHAPGKSLVGPIYLNKGRRTFYMQCGFHAYMESWAMAVNNPYYALTDGNGQFKIDNIPPGTYQLVVWHPQTGPGMSKMVTVRPDGRLVEQLSLPAPKGNRTAYKVMDNPRFGLEALGHSVDIDPFVELQH